MTAVVVSAKPGEPPNRPITMAITLIVFIIKITNFPIVLVQFYWTRGYHLIDSLSSTKTVETKNALVLRRREHYDYPIELGVIEC